jgi:hypothetical protein
VTGALAPAHVSRRAPKTARVALDQLVHATVALWRTQVVLIFTFAMPSHLVVLAVWTAEAGALAASRFKRQQAPGGAHA